MGGPEAEKPKVESPVEALNEEVVKVVPKKDKETPKMPNGDTLPVPDANGNIEDQPVAAEVKDANGNVEEAAVVDEAGDKQTKTVLSVVTKLKEDTKLSDCEKIDTLCLLVQRIVEENKVLKNEITVVGDQCEKQREAKEVIMTLNTAYKKQIDLVREESRLRLEEEQAKRSENMGGYNNTMTDLSNLLETHTAQNSRLREQNAQMASKMGELVGETEERDKMVQNLHEEAQLQIVLLQHQVYLSSSGAMTPLKNYFLSLVSRTLFLGHQAPSNTTISSFKFAGSESSN